MSNDTPRTSEALGATLEAGWDLGPQHRALTELCRELERETNRLRQGDTCARQCEVTAYRIEARRLRGERAVFAELFDAAARVIHTLDGEDTDEENRLRALQERLERAALEARGVTANDKWTT